LNARIAAKQAGEGYSCLSGFGGKAAKTLTSLKKSRESIHRCPPVIPALNTPQREPTLREKSKKAGDSNRIGGMRKNREFQRFILKDQK